jgi:hypothetical protein
MRDDRESRKEVFSTMIPDDMSLFASDESIALHVMHRFNIDRDTMESMPAMDHSLRPLLWPEKNE